MPESKLPRKLHKLLRLALDDLDQVSKLESVIVDMRHWIMPADNGDKCMVCLAGSVMAQEFGCTLPGTDGVSPGNLVADCAISYEDADCLYALDDLRQGNIEHALMDVYDRETNPLPPIDHSDLYEFNRVVRGIHITPHNEDPAQWRADMESMCKQLEKFDL